MKVNVLAWHGIATWHWDIGQDLGNNDAHQYIDELCGICRVAFDGTCPNCKYPGDDCPLVLGGGCTHNFHLHCILKWIQQDSSRGLCPMCRRTFTPKETESVKSEDLAKLHALIESHRIMAEGLHNSDQEFQTFRSEDGEV